MIMTKNKLIVLTFVGFYLPGYKAGGPLRTIVNMVEHLSDEFEFWIITRDRDLGDENHYPNIEPNVWCKVGHAHVYYFSPESVSFSSIVSVIKNTRHDVLYLNSFFDIKFTVLPLLGRYLKKFPEAPLIVAPRGEFSHAALKLKRNRKIIYMYITKLFGLYKNITWQASSEYEKKDISQVLNIESSHIRVALDLPSPISECHDICDYANDESLRIVFLSRISPMKNLDFALKTLLKVKASVIFDIYGPIEDEKYWKECQEIIEALPKNIIVNYCGAVSSKEVASIFAKYDMFLFPSRGENYGHVIAESLSVGTPVLLSDNTPWNNLKEQSFGWNFSLSSQKGFIQTIDEYSKVSLEDKLTSRKIIKVKIIKKLKDPIVFDANKNLFHDL